MSSKASMQLQSALIATGLVQPVSEKSKGGYVEVLCRQIPGQEKPWLKVVESLLTYADGAEGSLNFELHICRRYVRKNGQMVFGWHISITSRSAKVLWLSVEHVVAEVLSKATPSLEGPVTEERPAPQVVSQAPQADNRRPLAPGQHPQNQSAPPRLPGPPGAVIGTPPPGFKPSVRVIQNFRDENGKQTIIEEMQLPHVYAELNRPNAKGKGARFTGGGG